MEWRHMGPPSSARLSSVPVVGVPEVGPVRHTFDDSARAQSPRCHTTESGLEISYHRENGAAGALVGRIPLARVRTVLWTARDGAPGQDSYR